MNELIPIHDRDVALLEEELSMSILPPTNPNRFLLFIIPLVLLLFVKNRGDNIFPHRSLTTHSKNNYKPLSSPIGAIDSATLDKMKMVIDGLKKATTLRELTKNINQSGNSSGKMNMNTVKELLNLLANTVGEENKTQIQNLTNIMAMLDKIKDVKKIMEVQKTLKSEANGDMNAQLDHMIEVLRPMLPEEQAKNIDHLKKMAQMMKLMSFLNDSNDESENPSTANEE